jgi:hypothetical protein
MRFRSFRATALQNLTPVTFKKRRGIKFPQQGDKSKLGNELKTIYKASASQDNPASVQESLSPCQHAVAPICNGFSNQTHSPKDERHSMSG